MLFSLHNYAKEPITVWLINHSLSDTKIRKLRTFLRKKCGMELVVVPIGPSFFDGMPLVSEDKFSIEIYYRILIPWLLPENVDRALWLDSDIIICGDISSFYHLDLNGYCIAACEDGRYLKRADRGKDNARLGLDTDHRYFNSGVLLMNLDLIRKRYRQEDVCVLSEELKDRLELPDQDILNYCYQNSVKYADSRLFNCEAHRIPLLTNEEKSNIRILHYYGTDKPWDIWRGNDPEGRYWKAQKELGRSVVFPHLIFFLRRKMGRTVWLKKVYYAITDRRK